MKYIPLALTLAGICTGVLCGYYGNVVFNQYEENKVITSNARNFPVNKLKRGLGECYIKLVERDKDNTHGEACEYESQKLVVVLIFMKEDTTFEQAKYILSSMDLKPERQGTSQTYLASIRVDKLKQLVEEEQVVSVHPVEIDKK